MVLNILVILYISPLVFSFPDAHLNVMVNAKVNSNGGTDMEILQTSCPTVSCETCSTPSVTTEATSPAPNKSSSDTCVSSGGTLISNQCLTFSTSAGISWNDAQKACKADSGRLASLADSQAVFDYVNNTYGNVVFWVGGSDSQNEGTWEWLNGKLIEDLPWGEGQPFGGAIENCLGLDGDYGYDDWGCTSNLRYICEITTNPAPTPPNPAIEICSSKGGQVIGNQCIIFSEEGGELSWQDANEKCLTMYGPLSSPADPVALLDYVAQNYSGVPFWVGGYSLPNEKSFEWLNGRQIPLDPKQFPWAPNQPSYPVGNQICLVVKGNLGYIDSGCSDLLRYSCNLNACGMVDGSTVGYQCLVFREEIVDWNGATDMCASGGGQLLVPAYPQYFQGYARKFDVHRTTWVGGVRTDPDIKDSWYWLNGEHMPLTNFPSVSDQQFEDNSKQKCLQLALNPKDMSYKYYGTGCDNFRKFICELGIQSTKSSKLVEFLIRQYASGKFIGPNTFFPYVNDDDHLTLHSIIDPNMLMTFDIIDGKWGYIRHIQTGKIVTPQGGAMNPEDDTLCVLHSHRRPWALFALDQYQDRIIHRSGKFIKTDGLKIIISSDESESKTLKFQFVNPRKPNKEALPYGYAVISGDWIVVFSVLNPLSLHTYTSEVTTGRSNTRSKSSAFKYGFEVEEKSQESFSASLEVTAGFQLGHTVGGEAGVDSFGVSAKVSASVSASVSGSVSGSATTGESKEQSEKRTLGRELQESSSGTWSSEQTLTLSFTVDAGQSVAVWQRVFIAERHGHKAVHLSNIFADTNSSRINPNNFNGHHKRRNV